MAFQQIEYEQKESIGIIRLNRPEAYNAFSPVMLNEFREALEEAENSQDLRVIVITGKGKAFCSGGDVKAMVERCQSNLSLIERREIYRKNSAAMILKLKSIEKPIVASVNGPAIGAGCNLALACDIRIVSDKAIFGQVFVKRGLIPDWGGTYLLPRLVGTAVALELSLTGRVIDAETALKYGLINSVVKHEELEEQTFKLCREIAENAPIAVRAAKQAVYFGELHDLKSSLENEGYLQSMCQLTEDHKEGALSFVEKREAVFRGK